MLGQALEQNTALLALDLSSNSIGSDAGKTFATTLNAKNTTLQLLDLSDNELGVEGVAAFDELGVNGCVTCAVTLRGNTCVEEMQARLEHGNAR